ncbi:MAG TPA: TolC family protein [Terriglobales bacterium]|nr:TolC family protein [Terriglobales bacterium]
MAAPIAAQQTAAQLPLSGRAPLAGTVNAGQNSAPGSGINTLQPSVVASASFAGSTPSASKAPFNGSLSLSDAIARGLDYNLGATQWSNTVRQSQGETRVARSALMPNLNGSLTETEQQTDLKAMGFRLNLPATGIGAGLSFPSVVGPFNYMQLQASLSQSLFNFTSLNNYRASQQSLRANQLQLKDARDLVVLAVGGAYLGVIAAQARLTSSQAQLATANAILNRSQQQKSVGALAQLTVDQNQVQAAIQQLQLTSLENDLAKQKINLARMIGLPPTGDFTIADAVPFAPPPPETLEAAVRLALEQRADLQAADAQAEAARYALAAAKAERLPSAAVNGNYGVIGTSLWNSSHGVFTVVGTVNIPLWQGGRAAGDREQAAATLAQRQAEAADMRSQIEAQVRVAMLDLDAAAKQVTVADANRKTAAEALSMTRDRFQAGVINTVELIQAQQQSATAEQDYINSVYAHNVAKLTLARALGNAPATWRQYLAIRP